jgi:DNA replication and repair protein RecF
MGGLAGLSEEEDARTALGAWEHELAACAGTIDELRSGVVEEIRPRFKQFLSCFGGLPDIDLAYRRGWKEGSDYLAALKEGRKSDQARGFTQAGPHRANLDFRVDGHPAAEVLSRGQQKLAVAALKLAQGACLYDSSGGKPGFRPVFLVDDLPAELDSRYRHTLCTLLGQVAGQVFVTSVDADVIEEAWFGESCAKPGPEQFNQSNVKRFHVEQGEYKCLTS